MAGYPARAGWRGRPEAGFSVRAGEHAGPAVDADVRQTIAHPCDAAFGAAGTASDAIRLAISERPDVALFDGVMLVAGPMVGVRNTNENSLKLRSSVT